MRDPSSPCIARSVPPRRVCLCGVALVLALAACTPAGPGPGPGSSPDCDRPDMAFAGDVLLHRLIQAEAAARPAGFAPALDGVAAALGRADVAVVNLETPAASNLGPGGTEEPDPGTLFDDRIYTGYPVFNVHPSIAGVLRDAGVDVVQTANNHAMDRGPLGVARTRAALVDAGLSVTGTRAGDPPDPWHVTRRVEGATIAFLACTYSTNGRADPGNQVLPCYGNTPSIPELVQSLSATPGLDGVVLLPHWGTEYAPRPEPRQRALAQAAADAGAIAIVGTHPHVLQPIETLVARDGRPVPVAWSLGNLLASQWALERRTGAILYLDLARDAAGRWIATDPRYLPTRVERFVGRGVAVFPAADLPDGAASLAHARRILGPAMVTPEGCPAGDD